MCPDPNIINLVYQSRLRGRRLKIIIKVLQWASVPNGRLFPENRNCVCMAVVQTPEIIDVSAEGVSRKLSCQSKKDL